MSETVAILYDEFEYNLKFSNHTNATRTTVFREEYLPYLESRCIEVDEYSIGCFRLNGKIDYFPKSQQIRTKYNEKVRDCSLSNFLKVIEKILIDYKNL